MGIALTPIANSQSFGTWLQRTNDLVSAMSGNVVTTDASVNGAVTTGNAYVNGNLGVVLLWSGNSSVNSAINSTSFFSSYGFSANSLGLYHNNAVYANNLNITGDTIANSSGLFTTSISSNVLTIASSLSVNSSAVNVTTLTASGNVNGNNAHFTTNVFVGTTYLSTVALSIGQLFLTTSNLILGSTVSTLTQNVFVANSSGNIAFGATYLNTSWGLTANTTALYTNNITTNNIVVNTTAVGNSTGWFTANLTSNNVLTVGTNLVNSVINSTSVTTANIFATNLYVTVINASSINTGSFVLNSNLVVGNISLGNSTVNCFINSTSFLMGNSIFINLAANTSGVFTNGNMTVTGNFFVTGNITSTGTTVGTGDFIPSSNSYNLGNTTNRWTLWALNANIVNTITIGNTVTNATVNSSVYTGTANNTSFVGSVSAANIVSNAQLSANLTGYTTTTQLTNNLANYPTSTQLTNNLANYQTLASLGANVAAYLPSYIGVLNASSISIGNSTVNLAANSTALFWKNSTVTFVLGSPTAAQQTNAQYYFSSGGSWSVLPTQSGNLQTSGTTTQNIDSWSITSFYAAEYLIDVGDNNANNRTLTKILLTSDSNNAYITEYATIVTNSSMGVFESTSNSSVVTLNFTPVSTNTTVRWSRTLI